MFHRFRAIAPARLLGNCVWTIWVALIISGSGLAHSGELLLTNGDRLQGSLVAVNKSSLTWSSDSFGNLTVDKTKVASFTTQERVKIQGEEKPCNILGMSKHDLRYSCGDDRYQTQTELLVLDSIVPFVEYAANDYIYNGKMSLSGNFSRGNKVEDDLDLLAEVTLRHQDFRHVMEVEYESKSNDDEPADQDYELLYRLDWFFDERWFWYNEARWAGEESKDIDQRYVIGTGLGVQLWENPNTALSLEGGVDHVKELLDKTEEDENDPSWDSSTERSAMRFATKFRYKLPFSAEFIHSHEVLYSLKDGEDWEFNSDFGLKVPHGQGLFSEYKFEYDYDNQPANETKNKDTKFTVGIGYDW